MTDAEHLQDFNQIDALVARVKWLSENPQAFYRSDFVLTSSAFPSPLEIPHPHEAPEPKTLSWPLRIAVGCAGFTLSASVPIALILSLVNT